MSNFLRWVSLTHTMRFHSHYRSVGTGHIYQGRFLGFCSLHSHCDSVFQQFDQLSGTVSAGCHRSNVLKVFPRGCKFSHVGASFQLALPRQDGNLVATRDTGI